MTAASVAEPADRPPTDRTPGQSIDRPTTKLEATEGVLHPDAVVVLAVGEVLREDDVASEGARGLEDRGVPVRDAEAFARRQGGPDDLRAQLLYPKPEECFDESDGLVVRERIGSR